LCGVQKKKKKRGSLPFPQNSQNQPSRLKTRVEREKSTRNRGKSEKEGSFIQEKGLQKKPVQTSAKWENYHQQKKKTAKGNAWQKESNRRK